MRKAIIRFLMKVYLKIRKHWDPLIIPNKIRYEFEVEMQPFTKRINGVPHDCDRLTGFLDRPIDPNEFFNAKDAKLGCDDFQRLWSWWGVFHHYDVKEYVICNPSSIRNAFQTMHMIGVLEKDGEFYLTHYFPSGPFPTEEAAIEQMKRYLYYADDRLSIFYRDIKFEDGVIKDI